MRKAVSLRKWTVRNRLTLAETEIKKQIIASMTNHIGDL